MSVTSKTGSIKKSELPKKVSHFPVSDSKYFEDLQSTDEDDEVFRRYLAMEDDVPSGSESSTSSISSIFDLDLEKLGITEADVDEFLRKAELFAKRKRRNSLLDKVPHEQYLPYFLKNLLATQVRSKESEAEFQGRASSREQESQGYALDSAISAHTDGFSLEGESEAKEGSEGFVAETAKRPPPMTTDKERAFYIQKEIGRRGAAGANLADGIDERLHRRWSRTVWRQEMENLEPEYRLPVLILKKFKFIRENEPGRIGPGTYDVDFYQIQKDKRNRTTRGLMQNCTRRFPKEKLANENPGPGTYEYLGYEAFEDHCRHPGKVPLFQSGPCNVRGDTFKAIGSSLGPGQYEYKSGIEMLLRRKVSKRGPYDLYTPSRAIIPHGYQKSAPGTPLGPGEYTIRTSLDEEFDKREHRHKGLFSKYYTAGKVTGERIALVAPFWPRDTADTPGPGQYDPQPYTRVFKKNRHPFCISSEARPDNTGDYDMSPDKYRPELGPKYCPRGCGHPSAFISKAQRLDLAKIGVLTERLRGKDLPADHYKKITWAKPDYCI